MNIITSFVTTKLKENMNNNVLITILFISRSDVNTLWKHS